MYKWIWDRYKGILVLCIAIIIILFIIIYVLFITDTPLVAGVNLEKSDWLQFIGAYLASITSLIVSFIAVVQASYYNEMENNRRSQNRMEEIQPIFDISILARDKGIAGVGYSISMNGSGTFPAHKNIQFCIENVGKYPCKHIIFFDHYLFSVVKMNDKKNVTVVYDDSPDAKRKSGEYIEILVSDYERDENGLPRWFNINYEDVDGNQMFQGFKLKYFDDTPYYALELIEEV